jgi:hypothetical protein
MWPVSYQGKKGISSSQDFLFLFNFQKAAIYVTVSVFIGHASPNTHFPQGPIPENRGWRGMYVCHIRGDVSRIMARLTGSHNLFNLFNMDASFCRERYNSLWQLKMNTPLAQQFTLQMLLFVVHYLKTNFVMGHWMTINYLQMLGKLIRNMGEMPYRLAVRLLVLAMKFLTCTERTIDVFCGSVAYVRTIGL